MIQQPFDSYMRELILMVGLPRSGKTTIAQNIAHEHGIPLVSLDAIRLAYHGQRFEAKFEEQVFVIARTMVEALFIAGHTHVIVDCCNVTSLERKSWISPNWIITLGQVNVPPSVCVKRAEATKDQVMVDVIWRMAGRWDDPQLEPVIQLSEIQPLPKPGGSVDQLWHIDLDKEVKLAT